MTRDTLSGVGSTVAVAVGSGVAVAADVAVGVAVGTGVGVGVERHEAVKAAASAARPASAKPTVRLLRSVDVNVIGINRGPFRVKSPELARHGLRQLPRVEECERLTPA